MTTAIPVHERPSTLASSPPGTTPELIAHDDAGRDVHYTLKYLRTLAKVRRATLTELRRVNTITGHTDHTEHRAARRARNREVQAHIASTALANDLAALYDPDTRVRPVQLSPVPELSASATHSPGLAAAHHLIAVRVWSQRELLVWRLRGAAHARRAAASCRAAGHDEIARRLLEQFGETGDGWLDEPDAP